MRKNKNTDDRKVIYLPNFKKQLSKVNQNLLIDQLNNPNIEKQWIAIQQLSGDPDETILHVLKQYLRDKTKDSFLKSVILQWFCDYGLNEIVYVHKLSQEIAVNPANLQDVFTDDFSENVKHCLSTILENDNPTLYNLCLQIWRQYLFSLFPIEIVPKNDRAWAAAVHFISADLQGIPIDADKLSKQYHTDEDEISVVADKILKMERNVFDGYGGGI